MLESLGCDDRVLPYLGAGSCRFLSEKHVLSG